MTQPAPEFKKQSIPRSKEMKDEETQNLRGTFASVLLLGAFIVVCWAGVFFLFLSRR